MSHNVKALYNLNWLKLHYFDIILYCQHYLSKTSVRAQEWIQLAIKITPPMLRNDLHWCDCLNFLTPNSASFQKLFYAHSSFLYAKQLQVAAIHSAPLHPLQHTALLFVIKVFIEHFDVLFGPKLLQNSEQFPANNRKKLLFPWTKNVICLTYDTGKKITFLYCLCDLETLHSQIRI